MKKNFDNEKYYIAQKAELLKELNNNFERTYLEIGGKFIEDFHASRVLANYEPNIKFRIINDLKIRYEVIVCISALSIMKKKKRKDNKKTYMDECLKLIEFFNKNKVIVNIAVTRYRECAAVDSFIERLKKMNYKVYLFYEDENYPENVKKVLSKDGLGKNDYIPCSNKLVCVIAPGPDSGKFAVCVSQIFHESKLNKKTTYRKFETFLIPKLSINNPINLACSMAMCDVRGIDCIDMNYLKKYGELRCIDERDKKTFEILKCILPKTEIESKNCISEYFINNILEGIIDLNIANAHSKKEIIRRYKEYSKFFGSSKVSQIEFDEATRIYELIQKDYTFTENEMMAFLSNFIDYWGYDCQSNVCIEELSELIKAICKYRREDYDEKYKYNVLEELADVHNMVIQLEHYFGYEEIKKIRNEKILRTKDVLLKERDEEAGNNG